jgi:hypothetical protein
MNDIPLLLKSDLAEKKAIKFLKIHLQGKASNRDGLGTLVRVVTSEHTWTQFYDGKSGYLAQSSMPLYFGLGDAQSVSRVDVVWPSGKRQTISEKIVLNTTLNVLEPE